MCPPSRFSLPIAIRWLILSALVFCASLASAQAETRVALVIGNARYEHADKLANPVTDARNLRDALEKLNFKVVYGENLDKRSLERTIGRFAKEAIDADVALTFFAGHGATFGDVPYVVPVDAQFSTLEDMPYELVPVETLIGELRRAKGVRIAILDACRDNAAERELKRTNTRGGEISRGLARVKNPEGLIIAYATQYLSTAADGDPSGDSPFTTALLNNIAAPGLDVKDLFYQTAREVIAKTEGRQRPEISISFYDSYALVEPMPPPQSQSQASPPSNAPTKVTSGDDHTELSIVPWHSAYAVHTESNRLQQFVFFYCRQPAGEKLLAITLSHGSTPKPLNDGSSLESIVRTSDFEVGDASGRATLLRPKSKFARTYVDSGENKTDVVFELEESDWRVLQVSSRFGARARQADGDTRATERLEFRISGDRRLFDRIAGSCIKCVRSVDTVSKLVGCTSLAGRRMR
jgi:Caspase domain